MLATTVSEGMVNAILVVLWVLLGLYFLWILSMWVIIKRSLKKGQLEHAKKVSELRYDNAKGEEGFAIWRIELGVETEKYQTIARLYGKEKEFWQDLLLRLNAKTSINWAEESQKATELDKQWHDFGFKPGHKNSKSNEHYVQWASGKVSPLDAARHATT